MLYEAIPLDASMTAQDVIARLAENGHWLEPIHLAALQVLEKKASLVQRDINEVKARLFKDPAKARVVVRRQYYAQILWYRRPVELVLDWCYQASPDDLLITVLDLHEHDSEPPIGVDDVPESLDEGVLISGGVPVAVRETAETGGGEFGLPDVPEPPAPAPRGRSTRPRPRRSETPPERPKPRRSETAPTRRERRRGRAGAIITDDDERETRRDSGGDMAEEFPEEAFFDEEEEAAGSDEARDEPEERSRRDRPAAANGGTAARREFRAWPHVDAPDYMPAGVSFDVIVGFAREQQERVASREVLVAIAPDVVELPFTIEVSATGVDAPNGWQRELVVEVDNPAGARATITLVGKPPVGPEPVHLTTLEVRYIHRGNVCGVASRPLVIGQPNEADLDLPQWGSGAESAWLEQPVSASAVTIDETALPLDLTIELSKPDGNATTGKYTCHLYSPHDLGPYEEPFTIDLGKDAKSFASEIVDQVRSYATEPIVENLLNAFGDVIAEQFPGIFFSALQSVADAVAPEPPTVLFVSAEPYVPWELMAINPPLDSGRPGFLGAQVVMGRWIREKADRRQADGDTGRIERPPAQPPATVSVEHMAVMVGQYKAQSGLRALPKAKEEGEELVRRYKAVPLAASLAALKNLLDAKLEHNFEQIGGVDMVHFAGHGEYDPARADASTLFLSDGRPLSSILFRSARYGDEHTPFFFLNACMSGIGDQLLGDMGGFPGNCLKGGFAGVLGSLWEVDDQVAQDVAYEFWNHALPLNDGDTPKSIGEILRDLRARYAVAPGVAPEDTYLAYVYYGHPNLTLRRRQTA